MNEFENGILSSFSTEILLMEMLCFILKCWEKNDKDVSRQVLSDYKTITYGQALYVII